MASIDELEKKLENLKKHHSFMEEKLGWKVYGFRINKQKRTVRGDYRFYASKKVQGKTRHVYISSTVTTIDEIMELVEKKIAKDELPVSLMDFGVEKS